MNVTIDLDKLFDEAMKSMSYENDCAWPLGVALMYLYWNEFAKELEQKMMDKYATGGN